MLPLIDKFFKALGSEGVVYCHWKSNAFLAAAAQGEDDLDLLIGHESRQAFLGVLNLLGFKEAWMSERASRIPGILDYYGYDETVAKLVHVHAHYKLVLGQDMTKNYHLPIENVYLESSYQGEYFRIPAPEFEFGVFVIRMMLKHSTWNTILGGLGRLSSRERQEMEYLQKKVSQEKIGHVLTNHLPFLNSALFDDCLRSLQPRCPLRVRVKYGEQIQKALQGCRLRPKGIDIWLQLWRRLVMAGKRRLFRNLRSENTKTMKNGGMLVAVIGGDGAGKTTVIEGIGEWLSPFFATMKVHMGKPTWSWMTILIRGILKIGRSLGFYPFTRGSMDFHDEEKPISFPGYPSLIREVCTGRDRYLSYVKARKQADKGIFVICDRFPLPRLVSVDGPQIDRMAGNFPDNLFIRLLGKLESRYYRLISLPDLLCVLKVDPDTAVERKSDETAAFVRARTKEIWDKDWEESTFHVIDANRSKMEVLEKMKSLLWAHL
jgi:thymidylate kinase